MTDTPMPEESHALLRAIVRATSPRSILEIDPPELALTRVWIDELPSDVRSLELTGCGTAQVMRELRAQLGDRVRARDGLTLNVLAALEAVPDLVVLGRDPNWYTVLHALRLLARAAGDAPLPVVVVRQAGWPYERRDAYPTPEAIPALYLQPHARSGVVPGSTELDASGLFAERHHALFERTENNGVRTAIEDFVRGSTLPVEHLHVPGFSGLSVLIDRRRIEASEPLATLARELVAPATLAAHLDALERSRLLRELERATARPIAARDAMERAELAGQVVELRAALASAELARDAALALAQRDQLRTVELEAAKGALEAMLAEAERALLEARGQVSELSALGERLAGAEARAAEHERALDALRVELDAARDRKRSSQSAPASAAPSTRTKSPKAAKREGDGTVARMIAAATPALVSPASLELASRRLAKLRRDPKLFFAHSRFAVARKLSNLL